MTLKYTAFINDDYLKPLLLKLFSSVLRGKEKLMYGKELWYNMASYLHINTSEAVDSISNVHIGGARDGS